MRLLHAMLNPRVSFFWLGAIGALGAGYYLPGLWAASLGYTVAIVACLNARASTAPPVAPWLGGDAASGLTLNAILLRNGNWWPNVTYRPNVIAPAEAVRVLRQAADQISDDWNLHR